METGLSTETPIACTLETGDLKERLHWIAQLNQAALLEARREGARVVLTYSPDHAADVREMVRLEQQCCTFLGFDIGEDKQSVKLTITAPRGAVDTLDAIFAPFLTGAPPSAGCGCSKTSARQGEDHGC